MVERFLTKLMPNGLVHQYDRETQSTTVFRITAKFDDGRFAIAVSSGPEPSEVGPWELAHLAFRPEPRDWGSNESEHEFHGELCRCPRGTFAAYVLTDVNLMEMQQFGIVRGDSIPGMYERSVNPDLLRFTRLA